MERGKIKKKGTERGQVRKRYHVVPLSRKGRGGGGGGRRKGGGTGGGGGGWGGGGGGTSKSEVAMQKGKRASDRKKVTRL